MLLNHFNFRRDNDSVFITNDAGQFMFLSDAQFRQLVADSGSLPSELIQDLESRLFLSTQHREVFASSAALKVRNQKSYLLSGTQLHIFVLTKRCNQSCLYCQASASAKASANTDMTPEIGEHAVDIALQSPAINLSFEFQGGEPTLNFGTLRHIVEYADKHKCDKQIRYNLVTNLANIEDNMLAFLGEHGISVTTSLDGPSDLHSKNRPYIPGTSFESFVMNLERARKAGCPVTSAIQTTTRYSLGHAREIVDAYIDLGFSSIFVRPLTPLGTAKRNWERIGYAPQQFVGFYTECLAYILELALSGVHISEAHATILLKRIFNRQTNYMELRSPCGAAIGQMAYNYDGAIYPCDEGRMLAEGGDSLFRLGDVFHSGLSDLIESPTTKTLGIASCLELLPACSQCVYMPYCGTCPVVNYAQHGTIFPARPGEYRCTIYKGMLDTLFSYLQKDDARVTSVLEGWIF